MSFKEEMTEHLPWVDEDQAWSAAATGAAIVAGLATRSLVKAAWRRIRHEDPPTNPALPSTDWGEAIAWTAAVSVAVGTARLLARRATAAAWEHIDDAAYLEE